MWELWLDPGLMESGDEVLKWSCCNIDIKRDEWKETTEMSQMNKEKIIYTLIACEFNHTLKKLQQQQL